MATAQLSIFLFIPERIAARLHVPLLWKLDRPGAGEL
jgi:hypothetical protein